MSVYISNATGNFSSSSIWSLVEPTTFVPSVATQETGTTATTTSFVSSTSFTGVTTTLDGIAMKISSRAAVPAGTFSVQLAVGGVAVTSSTVTVNVSDIPNGISWIFFKFSVPVAIAGATTYTVQAKTSSNGEVSPFRKSATAADWTYALRETTTAALAAGDSVIVTGEWDSAGVNSSWVVTMDNTTNTQYGSAVTGTSAVSVNANGTFQWGTSASTAYQLVLAGSLYINNAGVYTQGTGSTPMPSTSSGELNFVCASNVQFGIESRAGSTFKTGGNVITNSALLAADAAATATSLITNVSTGWKNGDVIAIASTTRTRTDAEAKALTADASGTTLTITALTNAHSGTNPTQAELIDLTRNVSIFGTSTTFQAYININATATADLESTEFYWMGSNTADKKGIDVATSTGSCTINNCSMHDFAVTGSVGTNFNSGANNNFTFSNNVMYNIASNGLTIPATTGTSYTINQVIVIAAGAAAVSNGIGISDMGGTITNLIGTSCQGNGVQIADNTATPGNVFGTLNSFTGHSNSAIGVSLINITGVSNNPMGSLLNFTCWRNNTYGLNLSNSFTFIADTVTAFGNNTGNIGIGGTECDNVILRNMTINAGTTFVCPIGLNILADMHEIYVDSSTFGSTTTHSTGDINVSSVDLFPRLVTRNTTLSSATQVANPDSMTEGGFISLAKLNGIAGNHKTFHKYGTISVDTTIFNNNSPSTRLTPNNTLATNKLQSGYKKVAVPTGQTMVINVFVRKSVAGDGAAYNGNQPRLMLRTDPATGISADTVIATATNTANGAFMLLSGTTPAITDNAVFQFWVDVDGTAGWVNVDDWSANS